MNDRAERFLWSADDVEVTFAIDDVKADAPVADVKDQPRTQDGRFSFTSGGDDAPKSSADIIAQPSSAYPVANAEGPDTLSRYSKQDGSIAPERAKLHDAIVDDHVAGKTPPTDRKPVATFIGGGPGSGKTEVIVKRIGHDPNRVDIDPDGIKGKLPEYREMVAAKNGDAAWFSHEESSLVSKQVMAKSAGSGLDTLIDGTGDGSVESLSKKANVFRAAGHEVVAEYVTIDTDKAVAFAKKRGERSGRLVPEAFLRDTHKNVSRTFPEAVKRGVFDRATLWDNNSSTPKKIATSVGTKLTIHDPSAWDSFLAKGR